MKKIFSLFLGLVMVFALLPMTAFAESQKITKINVEVKNFAEPKYGELCTIPEIEITTDYEDAVSLFPSTCWMKEDSTNGNFTVAGDERTWKRIEDGDVSFEVGTYKLLVWFWENTGFEFEVSSEKPRPIVAEASINGQPVIAYGSEPGGIVYSQDYIVEEPCTHENTEKHNAVEATCTTKGYTGDTYCKNCGELIEEGTVIEMTEHYYEQTAKYDPTCTKDGYGEMTCKYCGDTFTFKMYNAFGHPDYNPVSGKEATCTEDGLTDGKKCVICDEVLEGCEIIPATGHTFGDWEIAKEATTTEKGEEQRVCSRCGEIEKREIAMLTSNPPADNENQGGNTNPGDDVTPPTDGGETKPEDKPEVKPEETTKPTEENKPADPTPAPVAPAPAPRYTSPNTGDNTASLAMLAVVSGIALCGTAIKKRK